MEALSHGKPNYIYVRTILGDPIQLKMTKIK